MPLLRFRHETDDWLRLRPKHKGVLYEDAFSYQIQPYRVDVDEDEWLQAVTNVEGDKGADIQGFAKGLWWIYVRIDGQTPYAPVLGPIPFLLT